MGVKLPEFEQQGTFYPFVVNGVEVSLPNKIMGAFNYMMDQVNGNTRIRSKGNEVYNGTVYTDLDDLLLEKIYDALMEMFLELNAVSDESKILHVYKAITYSVKYIPDGLFDTVRDVNNFFYNGGGDCEDWSFVLSRIYRRLGYRSGIISLWPIDGGIGHVVPWVLTNEKFYILERAEMFKSVPSFVITIPNHISGTFENLTVKNTQYSGDTISIPTIVHRTQPKYFFSKDFIAPLELEETGRYAVPQILWDTTTFEPIISTYWESNHEVDLSKLEPAYKILSDLTGYSTINRDMIIGIAVLVFVLYIVL